MPANSLRRGLENNARNPETASVWAKMEGDSPAKVQVDSQVLEQTFCSAVTQKIAYTCELHFASIQWLNNPPFGPVTGAQPAHQFRCIR